MPKSQKSPSPQELPKELLELIEQYKRKWGSSVAIWKRPGASAGAIERSDELAKEAGETEEKIRQFCKENEIDFGQAKELMHPE